MKGHQHGAYLHAWMAVLDILQYDAVAENCDIEVEKPACSEGEFLQPSNERRNMICLPKNPTENNFAQDKVQKDN